MDGGRVGPMRAGDVAGDRAARPAATTAGHEGHGVAHAVANHETVKAAKIDFLADTGANLTCIDVTLLPCFRMTKADLVGTNPPPRVPAQAGSAKTGLKGVGLFKARIEVGSGSTIADISEVATLVDED